MCFIIIIIIIITIIIYIAHCTNRTVLKVGKATFLVHRGHFKPLKLGAGFKLQEGSRAGPWSAESRAGA